MKHTLESLKQQIEDKAKLGTEIENLLDTDLEEEWRKVANIKWVKLDDVLGLLGEQEQELRERKSQLEGVYFYKEKVLPTRDRWMDDNNLHLAWTLIKEILGEA